VSGLHSASLLENARFNALVIVPNAVQGIFRRRRAAVAAATRANVDGRGFGLMRGMSRSHGGGPVWVRVVRDRALLLLTPADAHRALEGSPDPFASDPPAKRDGMVVFQPDAVTISRGEAWRNRRAFNEAVLDYGRPVHEFAERFARVAAEEAAELVSAAALEGGELGFGPWNRAFLRITRRVVLGDAAAEDTQLSEELGAMMSEANGMPGKTSDRYPAFVARLGRYVAAAEPGSLASRFNDAPADAETKPVGQVPHWLFANGDTLAINSFRALAAILSHPSQRAKVDAELASAGEDAEAIAGLRYLEACLEDAMRLWPTTPMLSRETTVDTDWRGATVPAGTQVLVPNTYLHRDRDRIDYADRFAPDRWLDGEAAEEWSFNHFSRGPQGCPGTGITLFIGKAVLAELLRDHRVELLAPKLDPAKPLPHMVDYFGIRVRLTP
jgi:cytochrome P450